MSGYLDPSSVCTSNLYSNQDKLCAGCDFDGSQQEYNQWVTRNCPLYISQYMYTDGKYDPDSSQNARLLANSMLTNYQQFSTITEPGSQGYNSFQNVIHDFCNSYGVNPGVCQNYLQYQFCTQKVDSTSDSNYISWCGCVYANDSQCFPSCNTTGTIRTVDIDTGLVQLCTEPVCIVSDVSVNIINSNNDGVTINQICPGCNGQCVCIVNNVDVEGTSLNINQYCGSNRICYQEDDDGQLVEVRCSRSTNRRVVVSIIVITVIVVIAIIMSISLAVKE